MLHFYVNEAYGFIVNVKFLFELVKMQVNENSAIYK